VNIKRTFALPFGYRATFAWSLTSAGSVDAVAVEWRPTMPRIRKSRPRRKFIAAYQAARREFFTEVAAVAGGSVLVVDTDTNMERLDGMETIEPPTRH
jgi:hypothetical protein